MKLINALLMLAVLVVVTINAAPVTPTWDAFLPNPFPTNMSTIPPAQAYGSTAFSSWVIGPLEGKGPYDFSMYYDKAPPSGSAGYELMEMNSFWGVPGAPIESQHTVTYSVPLGHGPILQHHVTRLWNTNEARMYLFWTPIAHPDQVMLTKMKGTFLPSGSGCNSWTGFDYWESGYSTFFTAPPGYDIGAMSSTVFNDKKYFAISLVSHGEPGPVVLLETYDMNIIAQMGMNLTQEDGRSIKAWESFTIFSAASPVTPGEEALYIYYVDDSTSKGYLRYASGPSLAIGRFLDVANLFPFHQNDRILVEQKGTAVAVSPNGQTVLLLRHGRDYCSTEANTMIQKVFYPVTKTILQDEPITVKDSNGSYRPVDAAVMPALSSDRCANDGYVHPGRHVNLMWADRATLLLMQGFGLFW